MPSGMVSAAHISVGLVISSLSDYRCNTLVDGASGRRTFINAEVGSVLP